jgi:hypothetical protein
MRQTHDKTQFRGASGIKDNLDKQNRGIIVFKKVSEYRIFRPPENPRFWILTHSDQPIDFAR